MLSRKKIIVALLLTVGVQCVSAKSDYDQGNAWGWACCTSLTSGDDYQVTGGGAWGIVGEKDTRLLADVPQVDGKSVVVLKSNGKDMRKDIIDAIEKNDIVVFDGSKGDFIVSRSMSFHELKDKTIIGRNGARICTKFVLADSIHKLMDDNKVLERKTSGSGHVLSNGARVKEDCEAAVRQLLIDHLNDPKENYRHSGLFQLNGCENIIMRNLMLVGPGAIDVGGDDLLTVSHGTKHLWVDHCDFVDGMDGNFDINSYSDFISVTWTVFRYTERTYVHANTNLVGSSDRAEGNGEDNLNVTYAFCRWGEGCNQRMPMVRFGTIHLLNDYYNCVDNAAAVNPRHDSELLMEGCYFAKGVKHIFKQAEAKSYQFKGNYYAEKFEQPADLGTVSIPYIYKGMKVKDVEKVVGDNAGVRKATNQ